MLPEVEHMVRILVALGAIVLGLAAAGCGGGSEGSAGRGTDGGGGEAPFAGQRILVAAAADLRFAFGEIKPLFERDCHCTVEMTFGSSGNFATQIEQGHPADVFFSANVGFVDTLESRGLIVPGTKQLYAVGRIALAKNKNVSANVRTLQDLLGPDIRRVSIANPQHAPYGVAAQEAMTKAGVWGPVQSRIVFGENASQATQFVETGDAQAGIVPLSLAISSKDKLDYVLIDASEHTPLSQGAAVMKTSKNPELGRAFIAYVTSPSGRAVMEKYGFEPPR